MSSKFEPVYRVDTKKKRIALTFDLDGAVMCLSLFFKCYQPIK